MEAGVVDGQRGGGRQAEGQLLVDVGEPVPVHLVGEIEVPERLAPDVEGHTQKARHRWVTGRETEALGVLAEVGEADGPGVDDQEAEDAVTLRQLADAGPLRVVEPDGNELCEVGLGRIEDPEGRVASAHQLAGRLHDVAEHDGEVQIRCDRHDRVEEASKLSRSGVPHGPHRFVGREASLALTRVKSVILVTPRSGTWRRRRHPVHVAVHFLGGVVARGVVNSVPRLGDRLRMSVNPYCRFVPWPMADFSPIGPDPVSKSREERGPPS